MAIEGLRKYSTTLFTGVLSGQQSHWSGLLPNHTNLNNHQLVMTASETIIDGEGKYAVYIIPDTSGSTAAVDTGLVLDLGGKDSAIVNFTGVIRGLYLQATDIILQPSIHISAVLSSFTRYKKSSVSDNYQNRLDYVSSDLKPFNAGDVASSATPNHVNMVYHQLSLMAPSGMDDVYNVRIIPESDTPLETSVDIGVQVDFNGTNSGLAYFGAVMTGFVLEPVSGSAGGEEVSVALSSTIERPDEIVYTYIGEAPSDGALDDHLNDFDNPHQVTYSQLGGEKPIIGFPIISELVPANEHWTIPTTHQLMVSETYGVDGVLEVVGKLIVLHDRPETRAQEPDFTYNLNGELTQIDYAAGEQKLFTYSAGQLSQVDVKRDGTTLRKTFYYTGGGELDYVTEQWL